MKRQIILAAILLLMAAQSASAVCPVCTVAVIAGVGLLRVWGVDDLISGIWIGALVISSSLWLLDYLNKKKKKFKYMGPATTLIMYVLFLVPMYYAGLLGNSTGTIFGLDRLLVGIIIGSVFFLGGTGFDNYLRSLNEGKVLFFYQKVILPMTFIIVASIITQLILMIMA